MKYCRWTLKAVRHALYVDEVVFEKSYRTLDEVIKVAVGFLGDVDVSVYDNDDVTGMTVLDIDDYVQSQREFERYFFTK